MVYPSKPAHKKQSHYVKVYLTETEYNVMLVTADKLEIPMSEWARHILLREANVLPMSELAKTILQDAKKPLP